MDLNAHLPSSLAFRGWSIGRQPHGRRPFDQSCDGRLTMLPPPIPHQAITFLR